MKKSRVVQREELGESMLMILEEFDCWFYPATTEEVGRKFNMFLKWLENNEYVITKSEYQL